MNKEKEKSIVLRKLKAGFRSSQIHRSTGIPFKAIDKYLEEFLNNGTITLEEIKRARKALEDKRKREKKSLEAEINQNSEEIKSKNSKSKIITISGEPVSGKGTVVSELKKFYQELGYKVDVINTGSLFRKAAVMEYKKLHPDIENPLISNIEHDPDFADKLEELDKKFDTEFMPNFVEDFNKKAGTNKILIIDSRLAWHFIPEAFDIRLTVDPKIAGERVFNDKKRGKEDQFSSLDDAINLTKQRKQDEIDRYKKVYGIDLTNEDNFDLVINTSFVKVEDVINVIKMCVECDSKGKTFCKTWASPKTFYPTQKIGETYEKQPFEGAMTLQEVAKSIKENGIYPGEAIESITRGKSLYQFVSDGHHRVFGSIIAGITLIPYKVIKHIEKETVEREYLSNIYDHEDLCTEPDGTKFRYAEYPPVEEKEIER